MLPSQESLAPGNESAEEQPRKKSSGKANLKTAKQRKRSAVSSEEETSEEEQSSESGTDEESSEDEGQEPSHSFASQSHGNIL